MNEFTMKTVPQRLSKIGDLWKPLLEQKGRTNLARFV
jgi:DNA primase